MENVLKHEFEPYFEDDTKANQWVEEIMRRVRWKLFRNQEDWLYLAGELGKRRNPMTRGDATDYILDTIEQEIHGLTHHIVFELLHEYHDDNIDFDNFTAEVYNDYFGYSENDEGYAKSMGWDAESVH